MLVVSRIIVTRRQEKSMFILIIGKNLVRSRFEISIRVQNVLKTNKLCFQNDKQSHVRRTFNKT